MEWTESLRSAIAYMEEHLLDDISADGVAETVHICHFICKGHFAL